MGARDVTDRYVVVDAAALSDLLDLIGRAQPELAMQDPTLASAIRGSAAQVRESVVIEPI